MTNQINLHNYSDLFYEASKNNGNTTPIYGSYEKLLCLSDWGQSEIHYDIVKAFDQMNIRQMTPIQQNSFLYLMNNYNVAMIGFSKGKSISYLASIFSSIIMNNDNDETDVEIGPKAIIFSSSLISCNILDNLSKKLISSDETSKIKIFIAYTFISVEKSIAALCNGCDILIATPTSFLNILTATKIFNWSTLKHLVFDNIDILLDNYKEKMYYISNILTKFIKNTNDIQMISASVKWTKEIDEFLKQLFIKWQYIFGSHLEAAHYTDVKFNVVYVENKKLEKISTFLKTNNKYRRCVLITSNFDELEIISNFIKEDNSNIEVLLAGQLRSSQVYTLQNWNKLLLKDQLVLICTDNMMFDFYIDNADCLIHYDIPADKRTFSIRFSVLQNSNNIKKECCSYIFLSEDRKDMLQLPKIVEIVKQFGNGEMESILLKQAKIINETLENEKIKSFFCRSMQQFGFCPNIISCQNRHILFKEFDEPVVNIPKSGLAIVKILNVFDASHVSAKLLKINCTNNLNDVTHWLNVEDYSEVINSKLHSFYSNDNLKIIHTKCIPGDIVAVQLDSVMRVQLKSEFFRAIVLDKDDQNTMNPKIKVKLIDVGLIELVSKWKVFILPDVLKSMQTSTVDIFLACVKPVDSDKTWCSQANICVKKQLKFAEDCCNTIIVEIKMVLGSNIWIEKLYKKYWDSKLKMYVNEAILPDMLISIGYADVNYEHIKKLTELSISAGIHIPLLLQENVIDNHKLSLQEFMLLYNLPQPQWEHIDQYITFVSVDYIITPRLFFVRNSMYYDRYDNLQVMIDNYIKQNQVEELKHIVKGALCLAKYPKTNKYYRIQITEIIDDELIEVFYVDLGDFHDINVNSLLAIHSDLIIQLPFQAIECSLSGIMDKLPHTNELEDLINCMFDLTQNQLYLKVVDTISPAKNTGGCHYEVILYDEVITVNLELQTNFNQYFDKDQMSKFMKVLINDENTDLKDNDEEQWVFNENMFDDDNLDFEDLISNKQFFDEFGTAVFGETYKMIMNEAKTNIENVKNKNVTVEKPVAIITPDIQMTLNKHTEKSSNINSAKEIIPVDSIIYKKKSLLKKHKPKQIEKRQTICLTCNSNVNSIVPMCVWYQNKNNIYLKLNILEIDNFSINSTVESLSFNAKFKNVSYYFCAVLYGLIIETSVTCKRTFDGFHIKSEKLYKTEYEWPRLLTCVRLHKYLKYDHEQIQIKDSTMFIQAMNKFKIMAIGTPLNSMVYDNDNDTDNDYGLTCDNHLTCDDFI